jgi:hypothetical protein
LSVAEGMQENVNSRTVQLVKLLAEVGPDIPEISRRLGQFKESVRYRYKEKILSKGFSVQASVNHEALGLRRMILLVDFADPYREYAQSILSAMNELCYLVGFSKQLIGTGYVVMVSVPSAFESEVREFFMGLKEKGMFTTVEVLGFDWIRVVPMKAEYYDFDSGRWDFEWGNPPTDLQSAQYIPSTPARFDYTDLLILKELQMDANKSLKEISDKLQVNYKKLAWHYNAHVKRRNLIRGFAINWMGTRYDYELEKALHRKHRYFAVDLIARNVGEYEIMTLRRQMNATPFIVAECVGRDYFARLSIPVDFVVEGMQYLGKVATMVKDKVSLYPGDLTDALTFTISYQRYNPSQKEWTFNGQEVSKRFEELIVQIREKPQ